MEIDYKRSDQELEQTEVVNNLKLVDVMHMLERDKNYGYHFN